MPKIITAHTGQPHITSDDMGAFHQSIIGNGDYLLSENPKTFKATLIDSLTIQLSKAEIEIQGTHIRILDTDQVTLDNGQNGVNRIDVIAVAYSKSDTGIENAEIKVIKGEPGVDPVAPEVIQSDIRNGGLYHEMPLFYVTLNGMSVQSIVRICNTPGTLTSNNQLSIQNQEDITKIKDMISDIQNYTILFDGAYYMNANQTIQLSKKVSEQTTGIALVFYPYEKGSAGKYEIKTAVVHKFAISTAEGAGHMFEMGSVTFGKMARKYLYIYDDCIKGNDNNVASGTQNGVKYNNANYVLRFVIGF